MTEVTGRTSDPHGLVEKNPCVLVRLILHDLISEGHYGNCTNFYSLILEIAFLSFLSMNLFYCLHFLILAQTSLFILFNHLTLHIPVPYV